MWQTKTHIGCPDIGSHFDFGWKKEGAVLTPVLYEGLTTSEVISDLIVFVRVKIIAWSVVPVFRMDCHAPNCAPVLPILTNVAMQLQVSSNIIIMKKENNNTKIKKPRVQNKRPTGFPVNL